MWVPKMSKKFVTWTDYPKIGCNLWTVWTHLVGGVVFTVLFLFLLNSNTATLLNLKRNISLESDKVRGWPQ